MRERERESAKQQKTEDVLDVQKPSETERDKDIYFEAKVLIYFHFLFWGLNVVRNTDNKALLN